MLPKRVMKYEIVEHYSVALQRALKLRIVVLGIDRPKVAGRLETVLRSFMQPAYNSVKYVSGRELNKLQAIEA